MKTLFSILLLAGASTLTCHAQGRVIFDNISPGLAPVTIRTNAGTFNPADGPPGAYVGSSYSVSLVFVNGTIFSQSIFEASNPIWVADAVFFGTTGIGPGHGPGGDLSGFFDGGGPQIFGQTSEIVTFQLLAWFNGGGQYTSYAQSQAAGHNVGISVLMPLQVTLPPGPAGPLWGLQPFTVGIPEPSALSLLLLGLLSALFFRRRSWKQ
jgi:hypothetical protein